jgi:hypothetical protein
VPTSSGGGDLRPRDTPQPALAEGKDTVTLERAAQ